MVPDLRREDGGINMWVVLHDKHDQEFIVNFDKVVAVIATKELTTVSFGKQCIIVKETAEEIYDRIRSNRS